MAEGAVTEVRRHEKVLHVEVMRRTLDASSTAVLVDDVLTAAGQRPGVPLVLDLNRVRFAPSVALGSLVQLTKTLGLEGRRIALVGVHARVMDPIRVTQLDKMLEIHATLDQMLGGPERS